MVPSSKLGVSRDKIDKYAFVNIKSRNIGNFASFLTFLFACPFFRPTLFKFDVSLVFNGRNNET